MNVNTAESPVSDSTGRPSRLWWWFVLAFVVQAAVWAAWLTVASHHRVEEVPLITNGR